MNAPTTPMNGTPLAAIVLPIGVLQQLDTSAIPPTAQVIPLHNVMRPDDPRPSLSTEEVFANAPAREEDYFRVAPVLE